MPEENCKTYTRDDAVDYRFSTAAKTIQHSTNPFAICAPMSATWDEQTLLTSSGIDLKMEAADSLESFKGFTPVTF